MDKILEDLIKINIRLNESFAKTTEILSENIKIIEELRKDVDKIKKHTRELTEVWRFVKSLMRMGYSTHWR